MSDTVRRYDARLTAQNPDLCPEFLAPPALPDWDDEDDD